MSQYPYQPPPNSPYGLGYYPRDPVAVLLAPAKRASIFMFLVSGLIFLCSVSLIAQSDGSNVPPAQAAQFQKMEQQLAAMDMSVAGVLKVMTVIVTIIGVLFIFMGVMVRRGGMGSAITSIILCCLLALATGLMMLGVVVQGGTLEACIPGISFILTILALVFLFQAARNSGQLNAYRAAAYAAMSQYPPGGMQPGMYPSQQPQAWQQPPPGQWGQPTWPPQPPQPPQQQQNWPPPPSNPT